MHRSETWLRLSLFFISGVIAEVDAVHKDEGLIDFRGKSCCEFNPHCFHPSIRNLSIATKGKYQCSADPQLTSSDELNYNLKIILGPGVTEKLVKTDGAEFEILMDVAYDYEKVLVAPYFLVKCELTACGKKILNVGRAPSEAIMLMHQSERLNDYTLVYIGGKNHPPMFNKQSATTFFVWVYKSYRLGIILFIGFCYIFAYTLYGTTTLGLLDESQEQERVLRIESRERTGTWVLPTNEYQRAQMFRERLAKRRRTLLEHMEKIEKKQELL